MKKIKLGIIGTGRRAAGEIGSVLKRCRDEVEIAALSDTNRLRLQAASKLFGGIKLQFTDYKDLLSVDEVEAVIIGTPDCFHEEIALKAFEAGKHVFCEKPLATTTRECANIIEASRKANKILEVGFVLRYMWFYRTMIKIVQSGALGIPYFINCGDYYRGGSTYFSRWNRFKQQSGGLLVHKSTHMFDILNWVIDSKPVSVAAYGGNDVFTAGPNKGKRCLTCENRCNYYSDIRSEEKQLKQLFHDAEEEDGYFRDTCVFNSEKDCFDNAVVIIRYENGTKVMYGQCFFPVTSTRRFLMIGAKGELSGDETAREIEVRCGTSPEKVIYSYGSSAQGHAEGDENQVRHFIKSLQGGKPGIATGEAAMLSVAIGEAAEIAAREHRVVEIKEILKPALNSC